LGQGSFYLIDIVEHGHGALGAEQRGQLRMELSLIHI